MMKGNCTLGGMVLALLCVTGCQTLPPGAEPGPDGTMAYEVLIEASEPGAKIEANGQVIGEAPLRLKIFGDPDGTFHDFGSYYYAIRALPLATNHYPQLQLFGTGRWGGPREDRIPEKIFFDMNQKPPERPPGPIAYPYPVPYYYPAPYYYSPYYYRPYYYHGYHHHHHHGGGIHVHPRR